MARKIALRMSPLLRRHVPAHLMGEYPLFSLASTDGLINGVIEACIRENLFTAPQGPIAGEGVLMAVK